MEDGGEDDTWHKMIGGARMWRGSQHMASSHGSSIAAGGFCEEEPHVWLG
ncbi:unnamed protein product [Rhodiola kirilowii]